ncbi:hypothetical protein [Halioglobus japonicus]|uniref:Nuclear transport factor 2 family protein n=1 Tax=Halioglobus japonicus TaxID=930805 RepID=A0AAP8MEH6_9GAMM|nr:hypothetical protein [Halioglobus japonicus]PLW86300.1 hypothetical protein C0029_07680 [Halioglobus japonicus]
MLAKIMRPLMLLLPAFLVACDQPIEESTELTDAQRNALELRVEERWRARIAHDWEKAWEYTSPAYREVFPKHLYVKKFSYTANWELTGLEVTNYDPSAAVASVVVRVMSSPTKQTSAAAKAIGAMPRELHERWILVDGEWWFSANY